MYGGKASPGRLNNQHHSEGAYQYYRAGWSLAKVGREVGANAETVRKRLRERNVTMRSSTGPTLLPRLTEALVRHIRRDLTNQSSYLNRQPLQRSAPT